jgi:hypothetical protein
MATLLRNVPRLLSFRSVVMFIHHFGLPVGRERVQLHRGKLFTQLRSGWLRTRLWPWEHLHVYLQRRQLRTKLFGWIELHAGVRWQGLQSEQCWRKCSKDLLQRRRVLAAMWRRHVHLRRQKLLNHAVATQDTSGSNLQRIARA